MTCRVRRDHNGWVGKFLDTPEELCESVREGIEYFVVKPATSEPYVSDHNYPRLIAVLRLNGITVEVEE